MGMHTRACEDWETGRHTQVEVPWGLGVHSCLVQVFVAAILAHGSAAFTTVGIESAGQECILASFRLAGDAFSRKERSAWGEVGASSSVRAEPRVFATSKGTSATGMQRRRSSMGSGHGRLF